MTQARLGLAGSSCVALVLMVGCRMFPGTDFFGDIDQDPEVREGTRFLFDESVEIWTDVPEAFPVIERADGWIMKDHKERLEIQCFDDTVEGCQAALQAYLHRGSALVGAETRPMGTAPAACSAEVQDHAAQAGGKSAAPRAAAPEGQVGTLSHRGDSYCMFGGDTWTVKVDGERVPCKDNSGEGCGAALKSHLARQAAAERAAKRRDRDSGGDDGGCGG